MQDAHLNLLCTGDIHLGRHPTRIPSEIDWQRFSPKSVWSSTVDEAIRRTVDAVLISGDVVDRENRFFEAYGAFENGARRLEEADIPVVVVAGNHDFDVLPRLVRELDRENLHLVGNDGDWDRWTLSRDGQAELHVDGWSFPKEHVIDSPLEDYEPSPDPDVPVIGLLHADLDTPGSEYAPVQSNDILGKPVDAWVLGHIHRPAVHNEADPLVLYPGSPQALDPGERGAHGPWMVRIDGSGDVDAEQIPLATVRYDHVGVDVSDADDPKAIPSMVRDRIEDRVRSDVELGALELLLARVRLTGRTAAHGEIHRRKASIEDDLGLKVGTTPVRIESIEVDTKPAVDLAALAQGESPAAYVADLLLAIENDRVTDEYGSLVQDALASIQEAHESGAYSVLRGQGELDTPDESDAVETLESQARVLLDTLLEQKEGAA
ncbi:metallophosphoesterase family protein [Natrialbaceae archaeon A-CW1-1]